MNYYKELGINEKKYIVNHNKENDIIIVFLANGEKYIVKNTNANIEKIEKIYHKQELLILGNEKEIKKNYNYRLFLYSCIIFLLIFNITMTLNFSFVSIISLGIKAFGIYLIGTYEIEVIQNKYYFKNEIANIKNGKSIAKQKEDKINNDQLKERLFKRELKKIKRK